MTTPLGLMNEDNGYVMRQESRGLDSGPRLYELLQLPWNFHIINIIGGALMIRKKHALCVMVGILAIGVTIFFPPLTTPT